MNIFSKFFKKSTFECNSIVSLANLVKDPDKDFFNKHKQDVKELEKTYGEIIKQNKTITSLDFTLPNNNKDSNYYSTTLLKITMELDKILNPVNNSEKRNDIDTKILIGKLNYYSMELSNYKDILFIQKRALTNIKHKVLLTKDVQKQKRINEAINTKIEQISNELIAINSLYNSNNIEINNYLSLVESSSLRCITDSEDYIKILHKEDLSYIKELGLPTTDENITITNIIKMEVELEKFIHFNDKVILHDYLLFKAHPKIYTMDQIDRLITRLRIYRKFKTDDNSKYYLSFMYQAKYERIKSQYVHNLEIRHTFDTDDVEERAYFVNALEKDIYNFKKDKGLKDTYQDNYKDILNIIDGLSKTYDEYKYEYLLTNSNKLKILFNIDNPFKLEKVYKETKISKYNIPYLNELEKVYVFDDSISLETVSRLYLHQIGDTSAKTKKYLKLFGQNNNETNQNNISLNKDLLSHNDNYEYAKLYKIVKSCFSKIHTDFNEYELYQGLKSVNFDTNFKINSILSTSLDLSSKEKMSLELYLELCSLGDEMRKKKVILNQELESFNYTRSPLFNDTPLDVKEFVINDDVKIFYFNDIDFKYDTGKEVSFRIDLENSKLAQNKVEFLRFIETCKYLSNFYDIVIIDKNTEIEFYFKFYKRSTLEIIYKTIMLMKEDNLPLLRLK